MIYTEKKRTKSFLSKWAQMDSAKFEGKYTVFWATPSFWYSPPCSVIFSRWTHVKFVREGSLKAVIANLDFLFSPPFGSLSKTSQNDIWLHLLSKCADLVHEVPTYTESHAFFSIEKIACFLWSWSSFNGGSIDDSLFYSFAESSGIESVDIDDEECVESKFYTFY